MLRDLLKRERLLRALTILALGLLDGLDPPAAAVPGRDGVDEADDGASALRVIFERVADAVPRVAECAQRLSGRT